MWANKDSLPTLSVSQVITVGSFVDLDVLPSDDSLFGSEVFAGGMIAFSSYNNMKIPSFVIIRFIVYNVIRTKKLTLQDKLILYISRNLDTRK